MISSAARSYQERVETPRRSRPPQSRGRLRRSASIVPRHPALGCATVLGRPAQRLVFPFALSSCSCPMSRSIGESLADNAAQGAAGPLNIINAESDPLVVTEIELGEIPLQVLLADVVIHADDSALQNREIAFDRIGVRVAAHVFLRGMIDGLMAGETFSRFPIDAALVSTQVRLRRDLFSEDGLEVRGVHFCDMEGRDAALALDQCDDRFLWRRPLVRAVLCLSADIGFIRLNKTALATQGAGQLAVAHCLADAMRHEPSGLKGDAKYPVKLIAADPLLRRAQQEDRLKPDMQLDVAGLEDGSNLDGEGLAAGIAFIDADTGALAAQRAALADRAAMGANPTVRPNVRLYEGVSGCLVVILGFGKNGHRLSPWRAL